VEPHFEGEEEFGQERHNDTPVLALLFFILPILGVFAILLKPMRWVFVAAALFSMFTMWAMRSFLPRARAITSGVLLILAAFATTSMLIKIQIPETKGGSAAGVTTVPPGVNQYANDIGAGSVDDNANANIINDVEAINNNAPMQSEAERVLDLYLQLWKQGASSNQDMVQYTWPEWRMSVADNPSSRLFFIHNKMKLLDWTVTSPTINDVDTTCTIEAVLKLQLSTGDEVKQGYSVLMHNAEGTWYVDPNSFVSGVAIIDPTPVPDPNVTPTPKPSATVNPNTTLYWNTDGGTYYHTKNTCTSIAPRYHNTMSSFKYSKLGDKTYMKLKPCPVCDAPEPPAR
jgi:hypothetical protein